MTMRSNALISPRLAPRQEIVDRVDQIAADGAAQAAGGHLDDILVGAFDQQMIDAGVAELVDDDGGIGEEGILQQLVQQGRLSGAEEAGQDGDGDGCVIHGRVALRSPIRLEAIRAVSTMPPPRYWFRLSRSPSSTAATSVVITGSRL